MRTYCSGQTKAGKECRAIPYPGTDPPLCINHSQDPAIRELKRKATSQGGRMSTAWKPIQRKQLRRIEDVVGLLEEITRKCASGEVPPRVASAVASASGQVLKGLEILSLKERLEKLEEIVARRGPGPWR